MTKVFLTGSTGTMGQATLKALLKADSFEIIVLVRDTKKDRKIIKPYIKEKNLQVYYGDLTNYNDVLKCMVGADIVLHCAALVSPAADYCPEAAMNINYGSTINIIKAIKAQPDWEEIRLVYIGTVAKTGDRMPPIHWGRVGDPIKPSIHDYYAVSKVAAERAVIESGLKYWVSLRQTGIISEKMTEIKAPIIFHNCLDNVLEYITEKDSGVLMRNCCNDLPDDFWRHIYNIGGGPGCRMSSYEMFKGLFESLGINNLENVISSKWFAIRNFHGQYYLDSDKLNDYLNFRSQNKQYFYKLYLKKLRLFLPIARTLTRVPGGEKLIGKIIKKQFKKLLLDERGTLNWIVNDKKEFIEPFFISIEKWDEIPLLYKFKHFTDWDKAIWIDHGYDESKKESELSIEDLEGAAEFRGGRLLSNSMEKGDWQTKLEWKCAFGHKFTASPRLILEGGHWCPVCERKSWNYHEIAKRSPFFAQVWYSLHDRDEPLREYPKKVSELDVFPASL
ncbi:NAD-dependent epimerase/dehydratase [Halothermothrix orenii H 168]|uniref:NAD-dependent epimerase/dehydratase n=2 Tax=Halothermothrix orenii TaxID=31909 RepID=B8CWD9_HALOH|nr:NAD-dependent epimerase/dehydratase [Halothermothrix orenii H 168]